MADGIVLIRWEQTASMDNVGLASSAKMVIDRFWFELGWSTLILRTQCYNAPLIYQGVILVNGDIGHMHVEFNEQCAEPRRFLWYWLRKMYDFGNGSIRLYIDSNSRFIDQIRRDHVDFPATQPLQWEFEKLLTRIRNSRNMQKRRASRIEST